MLIILPFFSASTSKVVLVQRGWGGKKLEKLHYTLDTDGSSLLLGSLGSWAEVVAVETCFNLFSLRLEVAFIMDAGPVVWTVMSEPTP